MCFGVKPSSRNPCRAVVTLQQTPQPQLDATGSCGCPGLAKKHGSKSTSSPLPGTRWMSTGYSDETEPFRSPAWPPAKQTPRRVAQQSRPAAPRPGASRRALKAVQSASLTKGISNSNAVSLNGPKLLFPSLPILLSSVLVVFSFIKKPANYLGSLELGCSMELKPAFRFGIHRLG